MTRRMGVAVLGTGSVSGEYVKAFQQNPATQVVALMSRDVERAHAKAREYGIENCRCYTGLDELLKGDGIDIVAVCTPHHMHVAQAVAAAQAGKHLVVEKPIAIDVEGLHRLDREVKQAGVRSIVGFVLRWNPLVETIKVMLADGTVGDVFYSEVDYLHGIGPAISVWEWMRHPEQGGSAILSGGCHAVDAMRWFIQQEAVEVQAYANTSKSNRFEYRYAPNTVALIKFAGGQIGKVTTSVEAAMPYKFNIVLMGDAGTIRDNQLFTRRWPGQTGWAAIPTVLPDSGAVTHHPFFAEVNHFVECILGGRESHCNIADAVKTHEICLAADISAREGRPVRLPLS